MKPETYPKCMKLIQDYIENDNVYDFIKYSVSHHVMIYNKNMNAWVDFAKENCDKEVYEKFIAKAMPFMNVDGSVNEEFKEKIHKLAYRVFQKKAGLIEVVDELTHDMNQFLYMTKQLRFLYKELPPYVYNEMLNFYEKNNAYRNEKTVFNLSFDNLNEKEKSMILKVIKDKNMLLNNITYYETYKYLQRKGMICLNGKQAK